MRSAIHWLLVSMLGGCPQPPADDTAAVENTSQEIPGNDLDEDGDGLIACFEDDDGDGVGGPVVTLPAADSSCADDGVADRGGDCDDGDAERYPLATEVCDGIDNDCDDRVDLEPGAGAGTWYFPDVDLDGSGDGARPYYGCAAPDGWVTTGSGLDCDDGDPLRHPGAVERVANGVDDDCDGVEQCFRDADGDGYGDPDLVEPSTSLSCIRPGLSELPTDCDDDDDDVNPRSVWFLDADGDDFGDSAIFLQGCAAPGADWVVLGADCDDSRPDVHPSGTERCDGVDQDCNGLVDDDPTGLPQWYPDGDGDGFGDDASAGSAGTDCAMPGGFAPRPDDCDDTNPTIHPGGVEWCTPGGDIDEDCDQLMDDADPSVSEQSQHVWFFDGDGDGYGHSAIVDLKCSQPLGYVDNAFDCNDTNPAIRPLASEHCDGIDEDCNGVPDDDAVDQKTWYPDLDGDGFGDDGAIALGTVSLGCTLPLGFAADDKDCVDSDADIRPYRSEIPANAQDDNCDGLEECYENLDDDGFGSDTLIDSTTLSCIGPGIAPLPGDCDDTHPAVGVSQTVWFLDQDRDGFGNPSIVVLACSAPGADWVAQGADCDDSDGAVHPFDPARPDEGIEICDAADVDEDCDGAADDRDVGGVVIPPTGPGALSVYVDFDRDGFGAGAEIRTCDLAVGRSVADGDCDDLNPLVFPGAVEGVADRIDQNCDAVEDCWDDDDNDDFGVSRRVQIDLMLFADCEGAPGAADNWDDCNDADPTTGLDPAVWFYDGDQDTFGDGAISLLTCVPPDPSVWVTRGGDCNDTLPGVNPGALEACNDRDDDCDGLIDDGAGKTTWYRDADSDGAVLSDVTVEQCGSAEPPGYSALGAVDCNDSRASVHPAATETCNEVDDDCDGAIDEFGATGGSSWWEDLDADGARSPTDSFVACDPPYGYLPSTAGLDCDDGDPTIFPWQTESCNGEDDDCDLQVDLYADCGPDAWRFEHPTTQRVYQFFDRPVSWFEADATCTGIGYHLVWFETATEEDSVTAEAMGYLYAEDDRSGTTVPDWFGIIVWAGYQNRGCGSSGWTRIAGDTCTPVSGGAYDTTALPPSSSDPEVIAIEREFLQPPTLPWLSYLGVEETFRFICEDYP